MAEDSGKKPSYLPIAGALFLGLVIGAAWASNDEDVRKLARDVEDRVAQVEETALSIGAGAKETAYEAARALETRVDEVESAAETGAAELAERLDALESGAEEAAAEGAEAMDALNKRIQVLSEQMADLVIVGQSGAASGSEGEAGAGAEAASETVEDPDATRVSAGQTAAFGEGRIFLSRVDLEEQVAHVIVVGDGPAVITADEPLDVSGCALTLAGFDGRAALISSDCGD